MAQELDRIRKLLLGDAKLSEDGVTWEGFDVSSKYASLALELETLLTKYPALSPDNGGDGESAKCAALEKWLVSHGITRLTHYDAPDPRVTGGVRPNLVAEIPGKSDDYATWICAHLDVVPVGNPALWKTPPQEVHVDGGRIFGRGVEDNQQGLCSAVFAAMALAEAGVTPAHTVRLLFMADEETGSEYGMEWLLREKKGLFGARDRIIVPDGGDAKGVTVEIAEKGILWLRFRVTGRGGHASTPQNCVNAKLAGDAFSLALRERLLKRFDAENPLFASKSTFEPTMQQANDASSVNMIPSTSTFCYDCRVLPCYTLDEVLSEVRACVKEAETSRGVKIKIDVLQKNESSATDASSPTVLELERAIRDAHGQEARVVGIGGGTVAGGLRKKGFDAAVWSTLEENAHKVNESALIVNILKDAVTIAAFVM